jgi:lipopolysaccharide transport system permease protein
MNSKNLIIKAGRPNAHYWRDMWSYRELFYFLVWRDVLVRYKQTLIGVAWAVIKPLVAMAIFAVVFGRIAGLPSGDVPYPIMVFVAMLPWQFFASALMDSSNSLVNDASLVTKIYFPRLIIPASAVFVGLVDFIIAAIILAIMMIWYGFSPGWQILAVPVFIAITFLVSLGAGIWFGALNVKYRDFRFIVPFVVQLGMFVSPVGFSSTVISDQWRLVYSLNPMVGVIDGFRWAMLGEQFSIYLPGFMLSMLIVLIILFSGIRYFRQTERTFADII